mgnify:FL=1
MIRAVFAGDDVRVRFEIRRLGKLATFAVEDGQILAKLTTMQREAGQLVLVEVPEFAGNLLDFWVADQRADGVELQLDGVFYFIAESFAGFVVDDDNMAASEVADSVTFESEPS